MTSILFSIDVHGYFCDTSLIMRTVIMTGINLWLDSYEDIYSDFDSRHYLTRRISEDFLAELKIEIKNFPRTRKMILLLPQEQRNEAIERVIASSLHKFFTGQHELHRHQCRQKLNKGLLFLVFGIMVMLLNSWIIYRSNDSFLITCLKLLLEPAGWFLLWTGLDFLLYDFTGSKKIENFYKALSEMHIYFQSTKEILYPDQK